MGRLRAAPFFSLEALRFQHLTVQAQEVEAEDFFDVGGRMSPTLETLGDDPVAPRVVHLFDVRRKPASKRLPLPFAVDSPVPLPLRVRLGSLPPGKPEIGADADGVGANQTDGMVVVIQQVVEGRARSCFFRPGKGRMILSGERLCGCRDGPPGIGEETKTRHSRGWSGR